MSLQVWLPLQGDIRNQGLGDYTISTLGTISWVAGKLGAKAMKAGDGTTGTAAQNGLRIEDSFTTLLNGDYSVSVWVKPYGNHVHYNGSIFSSGNWNTANKRWAFGVSQDNTKVDVLCNNYNTYLDCPVPVNEWTHLVCTCGTDRKIKLYKNGEYIGVLDRGTNTFDSDYSWSAIGRESYASGYFSFNGAIQDFRLYDHCLSPMEIKRISQGLVLHYPLNRMGFGQENLAHNTYGLKPFSTNQVEFKAYDVGLLDVSNGEQITISFDLDMTVATGGSGYLQIYNTNYPGPHQIATGNALAGRTLVAGQDIHERISYTTTMTTRSSSSYSTDRIEFYSNYSTENEIQISNIKIERGSKATPWCPNSSDMLATTMGLNSITEYDCSGFCNNGTRTGTFTWTSDTPKYVVSQYFNGSSYIKTDAGTFSWFNFDKCTIAIWMKPTTVPSSWAGTFGIAHDNSSTNKSFVVGNYGGKFTVQSANGSWVNIQSSDLPINEWHHCVATLDGTTVKMYIDGELVKTETTSWGTTTVATDTRVQVGIDLPGSDEVYQGYYSDARIYATALSADDVKSLYQNTATIDADGTIHGAVR